MDYGIELKAIIGLDMLTSCKAVLDLNNFTLRTSLMRLGLWWLLSEVGLRHMRCYIHRKAQELANANKKNHEIEVEKGSGNIFADLGWKMLMNFSPDRKLAFLYSKFWKIKLKQREIASILGIAQSDVSHLMNGHFSRFTIDKLLNFLKRIERKVTIQVSDHHDGEPYQQVIMV